MKKRVQNAGISGGRRAVRLLLPLFLALGAAGVARAGDAGGESPAGSGEEPSPEVIEPRRSPLREHPDTLTERYKREKIGERYDRMQSRMGRRQERLDLLEAHRSSAGKKRLFIPRVRLEPSLSLVFPSGSLLKGTDAGRGSRLDFEADLGLQAAALQAGLSVECDLSPHGGLGLSCSYFSLTGKERPASPLVYHGVSFPAGEPFRTRIGNLFGEGWAHYQIYSGPEGTFRARGGVVYLDQKAVLRRGGGGGKVVETLDAFFPFLEALGAFPLGRASWFDVSAKFSFLAFEEGDYRQDNTMLELGFGLVFDLSKHLRGMLAYEYAHHASLRTDDGRAEESRLSVHGFSAVLQVRF